MNQGYEFLGHYKASASQIQILIPRGKFHIDQQLKYSDPKLT